MKKRRNTKRSVDLLQSMKLIDHDFNEDARFAIHYPEYSQVLVSLDASAQDFLPLLAYLCEYLSQNYSTLMMENVLPDVNSSDCIQRHISKVVKLCGKLELAARNSVMQTKTLLSRVPSLIELLSVLKLLLNRTNFLSQTTREQVLEIVEKNSDAVLGNDKGKQQQVVKKLTVAFESSMTFDRWDVFQRVVRLMSEDVVFARLISIWILISDFHQVTPLHKPSYRTLQQADSFGAFLVKFQSCIFEKGFQLHSSQRLQPISVDFRPNLSEVDTHQSMPTVIGKESRPPIANKRNSKSLRFTRLSKRHSISKEKPIITTQFIIDELMKREPKSVQTLIREFGRPPPPPPRTPNPNSHIYRPSESKLQIHASQANTCIDQSAKENNFTNGQQNVQPLKDPKIKHQAQHSLSQSTLEHLEQLTQSMQEKDKPKSRVSLLHRPFNSLRTKKGKDDKDSRQSRSLSPVPRTASNDISRISQRFPSGIPKVQSEIFSQSKPNIKHQTHCNGGNIIEQSGLSDQWNRNTVEYKSIIDDV